MKLKKEIKMLKIVDGEELDRINKTNSFVEKMKVGEVYLQLRALILLLVISHMVLLMAVSVSCFLLSLK